MSTKAHLSMMKRPLSWLGCVISIPAFYLVLTGASPYWRNAGHALYALTALLLAAELTRMAARTGKWTAPFRNDWLDLLILMGALASVFPSLLPWGMAEWFGRLVLCGLIFTRLALLSAHWIAPHRLAQVMVAAAALLAVAGAGFYWLEPRVTSYQDGLWLAFTTGATVGYGDLVPSTPASRIFAVFIVLLGYALFSLVTASIAALFVGKDEKRLERELHADIRALRAEVEALRRILQERESKQGGSLS